MKKTLYAVCFAGLTTSAFATVGAIALDNFEGDAFNSINDSTNTALTSSNSSFYLGFMDESGIGSSTSVTELFSHFTQFGEVRATPDANPIVSSGFISGSATADYATLDTQQVYVFIMNDASSATATEALVWKLTGIVFDDDPNPISLSPQVIDLISANGTAVFGVDAINNDSYQLQIVVPEPSSITLLGLGSVALLLRRRR